jgi:hypothetical protein
MRSSNLSARDKSFAHEKYMKDTFRIQHSGRPPERTSCLVATCNSSFLSRSGLQKHLLLVHQGFVCKVTGCRIQFADKDALENHTRTHTRLECAHVGCERSYVNRESLLRHIRKMHGGFSGDEGTKIIAPAPEPIPGSLGGK